MSDMHDAWFFIGVFVFIFLIWIATGGPFHPIAFTGPRLALPGSSSGQSGSGRSYGSGTPVPPLTGSTFGTPSPYRGLVSINHYVSGANSSDPVNEYVQITAAQDAGIPVDLSEWTLRSEASGSFVIIPKGTEVPISGTINAAEDIVLTPRERAIVISGRSPIGASFRENKCIGYFSTF